MNSSKFYDHRVTQRKLSQRVTENFPLLWERAGLRSQTNSQNNPKMLIFVENFLLNTMKLDVNLMV